MLWGREAEAKEACRFCLLALNLYISHKIFTKISKRSEVVRVVAVATIFLWADEICSYRVMRYPLTLKNEFYSAGMINLVPPHIGQAPLHQRGFDL